MSKPVLVDRLSATSLRVELKFNSKVLSSASAFIVRWQQEDYLVTNWHVVTGRDAETNKCLDKKYAAVPDIMAVRFHAKGRLGSWISIDVPLLSSDGQELWLEHPLGRKVDVAAIKLAPEITSQVSLYPLDLELANVDMVAMPAMPVSVIGSTSPRIQ